VVVGRADDEPGSGVSSVPPSSAPMSAGGAGAAAEAAPREVGDGGEAAAAHSTKTVDEGGGDGAYGMGARRRAEGVDAAVATCFFWGGGED
jgi:hypothetical protein